MEQQAARNYKIDNGKAILIFLVVFGHILELFHGDLESFLYIVIYSFACICLFLRVFCKMELWAAGETNFLPLCLLSACLPAVCKIRSWSYGF